MKSLEAFQLLRVTQQTPAVLSLIRAFHDKKIKFAKLVEALQTIENFHFFFTGITSSRSSGGISGMYSSFGRKLFDATDSSVATAQIKVLTNKLRQRVPVQAEFEAAFEQVIYTNKITSQKNLVRYILLAIKKRQGWAHIGSLEELTIEHLVPQKDISKKWPPEIIGQLGNLILVDPVTNEKLGTKSFREKKKILIDKGYYLPKSFMEVDMLTPDLVRGRTSSLSKLAYEKVWKI